eukprot:gb/GECH01011444.1/.p1 GENE.gb/GECH01011444.1/~~gb/GECH01011444.1/.p1  ORF type:complete len:141 (+),score=26.32 gb/GECH01011444.1/:1-423(+)
MDSPRLPLPASVQPRGMLRHRPLPGSHHHRGVVRFIPFFSPAIPDHPMLFLGSMAHLLVAVHRCFGTVLRRRMVLAMLFHVLLAEGGSNECQCVRGGVLHPVRGGVLDVDGPQGGWMDGRSAMDGGAGDGDDGSSSIHRS